VQSDTSWNTGREKRRATYAVAISTCNIQYVSL
jgi:hypothetical protein